MKNTCKHCGGSNHTSLMCFSKPRKPLSNKKVIKRVGKKGAQWIEDRNQYLQDHPPDHSGYWYCVVAGGALTADTVTLDHDNPRSKGGKNDDSNVNVMCGFHNGHKGSKTLEQYMTTNPPPCRT